MNILLCYRVYFSSHLSVFYNIFLLLSFFFRDRDQSHQVLSRPRYIPTQFENSLGKLQFASVIAPRKVIDMDVVPNSDPQLATQIQQKDTKRTRQLLLEIERVLLSPICFF